MPPSPRQLNIPHDSWRPGQYEAYQWIKKNKKNSLIVEAPTGCGKTLIGAALGTGDKTVRALTHTRNLQKQYQDYHFSVLFGMAAYECAYVPVLRADTCLYLDNMHNCPVSEKCQYLTTREILKRSQRQSLSYAYFLTANWMDNPGVDYLYQDEAHFLPQIVMGYMTLRMTPLDCRNLRVETFPSVKFPVHSVKVRIVSGWLERVIESLEEEIKYREGKRSKSPKVVQWLMKLKRAKERFVVTLNGLTHSTDDFYLSATDQGLVIQPLTAAPFYNKLFVNSFAHKGVLTSATIGNVKTFAGSLGLSREQYDFLNVPSNFAPEQMPVWVAKDCPRIGYSTPETAKKKQAEIIANVFNKYGKGSPGIIHCASKVETRLMAKRLATLGLGDRIYVPQETTSTEEKVINWRKQLARVEDTIAIVWSFHTGLDAPEAKINIVAKVPFAALDEPTKLLMERYPRFYKWNAANLVEQAAGRIRRGVLERDYEVPGTDPNKIVMLADGNISMVKSQFSQHFRDCMVDV